MVFEQVVYNLLGHWAQEAEGRGAGRAGERDNFYFYSPPCSLPPAPQLPSHPFLIFTSHRLLWLDGLFASLEQIAQTSNQHRGGQD